MKLRRILVSKGLVSEWLKHGLPAGLESVDAVPDDLEVSFIRDALGNGDAIEVVVRSEAFEDQPSGARPPVWDFRVRRTDPVAGETPGAA